MKYGWPLGHARARVVREGEELKRRRGGEEERRKIGEEKREQRRGGKKRDFKIFKRV